MYDNDLGMTVMAPNGLVTTATRPVVTNIEAKKAECARLGGKWYDYPLYRCTGIPGSLLRARPTITTTTPRFPILVRAPPPPVAPQPVQPIQSPYAEACESVGGYWTRSGCNVGGRVLSGPVLTMVVRPRSETVGLVKMHYQRQLRAAVEAETPARVPALPDVRPTVTNGAAVTARTFAPPQRELRQAADSVREGGPPALLAGLTSGPMPMLLIAGIAAFVLFGQKK